mgnify:FL=1
MESKIKEDFEFAEELFAPLNEEERKLETIVRPSVGYWKDAWRRLKANKVALISLIIILLVILLAIIVPIVSPYGYAETNHKLNNQGPTLQHIFGTDAIGRDIFLE